MNIVGRLSLALVIAGELCCICDADTNSNREIWLWPQTNGSNLGTAADPYDVSTPEKFDSLMRSLEQASPPATNLLIHLRPGTYSTAGYARNISNDPPTQGWTPRQGWVFRGSGMESSVIKLIALNGEYTNNTVIWSHMPAEGGIEIYDLTVDCNYQNLDGARSIQAISLRGSHNKVVNVRVINAKGGLDYEAFILSVGNVSTDSYGNVISGCIVDQYQGGYCTAINVGNNNNNGVGYKTKTEALVLNNQVMLNPSLGGSQIAYGAYAVRDARFINNYAAGASYGFILDSWENDNLLLAGNIFVGIESYGVLIGPPALNRGVVANNCFEISGQAGAGLQIQNNASNVLVSNNRFWLRAGITSAYFRISENAEDISVCNNIFDPGFTATVGSSRYFSVNNRLLTGAALPGLPDTAGSSFVGADRIIAGGASYTGSTIASRGPISTENYWGGAQLQIGRDDGTYVHVQGLSSDRSIKIQPHGAGSVSLAADSVISGQTRIKSGSAASPGLAFNSIGTGYDETNTGIFKPAASNLGFSVAGNEMARLSPDGLAIGHLGSPIKRVLLLRTNLVFSLGASASLDKAVTLTGCAPGDAVSLGIPSQCVASNTSYFAWVSNTNEISIRALNPSGTTPAVTGVFTVVATQF